MNGIDCTQARELLMEADLADLQGSASPLAQHVAECARCAALAQTLFEGYAHLEHGLAMLGTAETTGTTGTTRKKATIAKRRTRWPAWAALPLAAAAALMIFLARDESQPLTQPTFLAQLMFPEQPQVNPPAGKQAVIIEKSDLTVVWLY